MQSTNYLLAQGHMTALTLTQSTLSIHPFRGALLLGWPLILFLEDVP
jgi:hypothetical protein